MGGPTGMAYSHRSLGPPVASQAAALSRSLNLNPGGKAMPAESLLF